MARERNYKEEYKYHGTEEQRRNRAARNKARRELEKIGRVSKGDGKDVGHKRALINGGSNSKANLEVQTVKGNRGWRRGRSNYTPD